MRVILCVSVCCLPKILLTCNKHDKNTFIELKLNYVDDLNQITFIIIYVTTPFLDDKNKATTTQLKFVLLKIHPRDTIPSSRFFVHLDFNCCLPIFHRIASSKQFMTHICIKRCNLCVIVL